MNLRSLAGAGLVTVALSSAAFAAALPHPAVMHQIHKIPVAAKCVSLEHQFTAAETTHMKARWLKTAQSLDARGTKLCAEGKPISGEWDLRKALHDIGVSAKA